MPTLVSFSILLLAFGLLLLLLAGRRRKASGLPAGRIIYSDTQAGSPMEKPLFDAELGLTGKPDYLVESAGEMIPVEVKSTRTHEAPYDSHIFQLAAYCRLVETTYGKRPAYGILHYPKRSFAVDYTPALEAALLERLALIRQKQELKSVDRSHQAAERCRSCGYRSACDQKLE